ncbi:hypothetical protein Hdeb2414_s0032g00717411 [Helianthus debilis subsp. tardiflorus]
MFMYRLRRGPCKSCRPDPDANCRLILSKLASVALTPSPSL